MHIIIYAQGVNLLKQVDNLCIISVKRREKSMRKEKCTTLSLKGLEEPYVFLWIKGFVHGKFRTGGLDPESNVITSGWVAKRTEEFQSVCKGRLSMAEQRLAKKWEEADKLILKYEILSNVLANNRDKDLSGDSGSAAARARDQVSKDRATSEARYISAVEALSALNNDIKHECKTIDLEIGAAANMLQSQFAAYGHGLLRKKPVSTRYLPDLPRDDSFTVLLQGHEQTWDRMTTIVKKVK